MADTIQRIAIVGCGQVGTSILLAIATRHKNIPITVFDPNPNTEALVRQKFQSEGLDPSFIQFKKSIDGAVQGADLIILATPMNAFETVSADIARHAPSTAILTDTGSAKKVAIEQITRGLAKSGLRYVPAHPSRGNQGTGPLSASASDILDKHSIMFLISAEGESFTPQQDTAEHCVQAFWSSLGVTTTFITAEAHDNFFGQCSHFQHALAFALMNSAKSHPNILDNFRHAGTGLCNLSRVAICAQNNQRISPLAQMWMPVFDQNQHPILASYSRFKKHLETFLGFIERENYEGLKEKLNHAHQFRQSFNDPERREIFAGELADIACIAFSPSPTPLSPFSTNVLLPYAIAYAQLMSADELDPEFISQKANASFQDATHPATYPVEEIIDIFGKHRSDFQQIAAYFMQDLLSLMSAIESKDEETIQKTILIAQKVRDEIPPPRRGIAVRPEYEVTYERRCDAA